MIHTKIFTGLQKELKARYEISSTIKHRGERGRSRETGVAGFLKENLPEAFGVGTGEVFSFGMDEVSPQCDIIIYDRLRTPIFGRDKAVQQIPIEGVYAITEVKSIINTSALKDAWNKFQAIRELWRAAKPENASSTWDDDGPAFFLFGYKLKTTPRTCLTALKNNSAEDITVVALDSGCSIWVGPAKSKAARPEWLDTINLGFEMYFTLAYYYFSVLEECQSEPHRLNFHKILLSC